MTANRMLQAAARGGFVLCVAASAGALLGKTGLSPAPLLAAAVGLVGVLALVLVSVLLVGPLIARRALAGFRSLAAFSFAAFLLVIGGAMIATLVLYGTRLGDAIGIAIRSVLIALLVGLGLELYRLRRRRRTRRGRD